MSKLTQIHFNGIHFINVWLTQRTYSVWPVAQPIVREMEMHSVANLATFTDPLTASQKAPSDKSLRVCPNLILFLRVAGTAVRARGLAVPARTHTPFSLSLSLSMRLSYSASGGEEQRFQLNTDIMLLL